MIEWASLESQALGSLADPMTNQVGNQIDEVVGLVGACCVVLPADHELVFV